MSNRVYLWSWGSHVRRTHELEGSHDVPMFWLACFDPGDVRTSDEKGFAPPPGWERPFLDGDFMTYALCAGSDAVRRATARLPRIGRLLDREAYAAKFIELLADRYGAHDVMLQVTELRMLDRDYAPRLREHLALVADPAVTAASLLRVLGDDWQRARYADNLLLGWGTGLSSHER